jgi:hypothetical protein
MSQPQQYLGNHARYVPLFHFVMFGVFVANLIRAVRTVTPVTNASLYDLALAVAFILLSWYARAFPLTVQDRVIRLEERLRLAELAPELAKQSGRITPGQWTALRFASDDEFVDLARQVLDGKLTAPGDIKKAVKHWRADHLRV